VVLVLLEIGQGNLDDTVLEGVVGVLQTSGPVDKGLSDTVRKVLLDRALVLSLSLSFWVCSLSDGESRWCLD